MREGEVEGGLRAERGVAGFERKEHSKMRGEVMELFVGRGWKISLRDIHKWVHGGRGGSGGDQGRTGPPARRTRRKRWGGGEVGEEPPLAQEELARITKNRWSGLGRKSGRGGGAGNGTIEKENAGGGETPLFEKKKTAQKGDFRESLSKK